MDGVGVLRARYSYKEIIGLDVSVNEGLVVDSLYTRNLQECNKSFRTHGKRPAERERRQRL